jgi:hypothetical protein
MNIPLSKILSGVSKQRGVTLLCPHRVYPREAEQRDIEIQCLSVSFGWIFNSETGQGKGLGPYETTGGDRRGVTFLGQPVEGSETRAVRTGGTILRYASCHAVQDMDVIEPQSAQFSCPHQPLAGGGFSISALFSRDRRRRRNEGIIYRTG